MNRFFTASLIAALASTTTAFTFTPPATCSIQRTESTTARHVLLSEEEISSVIDSATNCAEGECSVEDVNALISELKDQKSQMEERLKTIENMVYKLEHLNESENREIDQVRQTVRDFLRVFNTDKPAFFPLGFAGDVGDGPKTAYDVLPPKKWSADAQP
eukprot:CAMPEP_0178959116 /NCGR_PEP_ID=MMETSP0789-20121207/12076_1 /TAXON_ID=3005 /ORGANISM="Rhizosolenia setigera, Strain CCMP 1694" /LENGTH=159 /DNA_ID=CAMNT_0020642011 /DNA_START=9 /DNA_END=488 /DNA_ORIENTATION=-